MGMIQNMMSDMTGPMDSDEEGDDQSGQSRALFISHLTIFFQAG